MPSPLKYWLLLPTVMIMVVPEPHSCVMVMNTVSRLNPLSKDRTFDGCSCGLQAQAGNWREQVLDELQGPVPAEQLQGQHGSCAEPQSATSTRPEPAEGALTAGPAASSTCGQPALR